MKTCLNCQKEFEYKREAAKFCSDKCRVMHNRKHPKDRVTKTQMEVLYHATLDALTELKAMDIRRIEPVPQEMPVAAQNTSTRSQYTEVVAYDYSALKQLIMAATSSFELERAWEIVKAAQWEGWQNREFERLRAIQQTKIDF